MVFFRQFLQPATKAYFGVRARIHIRHWRGHRIHSPFVYGLMREVFMPGRITGEQRALYEALSGEGLSGKEATMLQNLFTYGRFDGYALIGPGNSNIEEKNPGRRDLCILLPGANVRQWVAAAQSTAEEQGTLVVLAPFLHRRGREILRTIRQACPCVSIDRCNHILFIFDRRLQPQHYRI